MKYWFNSFTGTDIILKDCIYVLIFDEFINPKKLGEQMILHKEWDINTWFLTIMQ